MPEDNRTPAQVARDTLAVLAGKLERMESDAEKEKADAKEKSN